MSQPRRPFQTDALNPSALPGSSRRHLPSRPLPGLDPDADTLADGDRQKVLLQAEYEEWNQRIDREMKACAGGLKELVSLADLGPNPSADRNAVLSLSLRLRTSSLIASLQALRNTAHELKLTLLLADQGEAVRRRDREAAEVTLESRRERARVQKELRGLLGLDNGEDDGERRARSEPDPLDAGQDAGRATLPEIRTQQSSEPDMDPPEAISKTGDGMELDDEDDFEEIS